MICLDSLSVVMAECEPKDDELLMCALACDVSMVESG